MASSDATSSGFGAGVSAASVAANTMHNKVDFISSLSVQWRAEALPVLRDGCRSKMYRCRFLLLPDISVLWDSAGWGGSRRGNGTMARRLSRGLGAPASLRAWGNRRGYRICGGPRAGWLPDRRLRALSSP